MDRILSQPQLLFPTAGHPLGVFCLSTHSAWAVWVWSLELALHMHCLFPPYLPEIPSGLCGVMPVSQCPHFPHWVGNSSLRTHMLDALQLKWSWKYPQHASGCSVQRPKPQLASPKQNFQTVYSAGIIPQHQHQLSVWPRHNLLLLILIPAPPGFIAELNQALADAAAQLFILNRVQTVFSRASIFT